MQQDCDPLRCNRLPQLYRYLASCYTHMGRLDEPERSLSGLLGPSLLSSHRASFLTETQSTASFSCRVCVWLLAKRHDRLLCLTAILAAELV
jgi:hypothetical protein